VEHNLKTAGYEVATFLSGSSVLTYAIASQPALILLDIMLPGINGFDLCRQIRQTEQVARTPVIFFSARTQEPDRVQAFEAGGDGFITKPFSPRELIVRIRNVLRSRLDPFSHEVIQVGDLQIDISSMTVRVEGGALNHTEFRLLEYLARHRGRVLPAINCSVQSGRKFVCDAAVDRRFCQRLGKNREDARHQTI
jgi:DNA-binding response OmpR family regulator